MAAEKVIWYDGMFLRPQHFQQQDRHLEGLIRDRCGHLRPYDWGVLELVLDAQAARQGRIALKKARGILPDGSPFDLPDGDELPPPLEVEAGWQNVPVFLALPLARDSGDVDREEGGGVQARYRAALREVRDLNAGFEEREQTIKVGRRQFRLLPEAERRRGGYAGVAVARLVKKRADQALELDPDFIPPCLDCRGWPLLREFLAEIQGLLGLCQRDVAGRLQGAAAAGGEHLEDLLVLQTVNRYKLLFDHYAAMAGLHPEAFYRTALQLAGELAAVARETRRPRLEAPVYDHDDLQRTFAPLLAELRHGLEWRRRQVVIQIPIEAYPDARWLAPIGPAQRPLLDAADLVLIVRAGEEQRQDFPKRCTISAAEELVDLVKSHLPGLGLRPLSAAPPGLPFDRSFTYFDLQRDPDHWEKLRASHAGLAFHVGGNVSGLEMFLYAIRREAP